MGATAPARADNKCNNLSFLSSGSSATGLTWWDGKEPTRAFCIPAHQEREVGCGRLKFVAVEHSNHAQATASVAVVVGAWPTQRSATVSRTLIANKKVAASM